MTYGGDRFIGDPTGQEIVGKRSVQTGENQFTNQSIYGPTYGSTSQRQPSTFRNDLRRDVLALNRGGGGSYAQPTSQAMRWIPQQIKSTTSTSSRKFDPLPDLPEYAELDRDQIKSDTQQFSALGRREAKQNFQQLLSRIYGGNPDDPYSQNIARKASGGFSMDTQRAISAGGREALQAGVSEQQQKNARRMTAYSAAVSAVLSGGTTTTTKTNEYGPVPFQAYPQGVDPNARQEALSTKYDPNQPLSLGQPYTYG